MRFRAWACAFSAVVASCSFAQGQPDVHQRLIQLANTDSQAAKIHREFCKKFGARLTGTENLLNAQKWAMERLKAFGWQNVRLEQWGELPVGFVRGKNMSCRMVAPYAAQMNFAPAAWSAGTRGPVRAEVALQPATLAELEKVKDQLNGKWILMQRLVGMGGARRPSPLSAEQKQRDPALAELERVDLALDKLGIAGRIYGGSDKRNIVHTSGSWQNLDPANLPTDPRVSVGLADSRTLRRLVESGQKPVVEINVDQRFVPGKAPTYNVVAELPGSDKADELVILGAHFDSWDGPGSEGASDNGTGSATQLEAARLLAKAGAKPRRTIRLVLFSGEEQGLFGSRGDVTALGDKIKKVQAMINEDSGSNFQSEVRGLVKWQPVMERALSTFNTAYPDWAIKFTPIDQPWMRGGGSDHASYLQAGVPAFMWGKRGPQVYTYIWHTQNDTTENAVPEALRQMSINHALLAYNLACADEFLYRPDKVPTIGEITGPKVGSSEDDHDHDHDH